jgi:hypothetical protein
MYNVYFPRKIFPEVLKLTYTLLIMVSYSALANSSSKINEK